MTSKKNGDKSQKSSDNTDKTRGPEYPGIKENGHGVLHLLIRCKGKRTPTDLGHL